MLKGDSDSDSDADADGQREPERDPNDDRLVNRFDIIFTLVCFKSTNLHAAEGSRSPRSDHYEDDNDNDDGAASSNSIAKSHMDSDSISSMSQTCTLVGVAHFRK